MEKDARQSVFCVVGEMLQDGMKVIAVARKQVGRRKKTTPDDEKDMTLVGYLFFFDAPKQTEGESVTALKRLKVIPKILTGDSHCTIRLPPGWNLCRTYPNWHPTG